jgi:hypothetical protein
MFKTIRKRVNSWSGHRRTGVIVFIAFFAVMVGRFVFYNIVVPWPYRHELNACLEQARSAQDAMAAKNQCFRTYPHFN